MDKSFEPGQIESKWYAKWEAAGLFKPSGDGTPYCILLPPPNVTGTLHMGHAFQQTVMDALTRYHRMRGFRTLWQGGTDHAGIATQKIVENQLAADGQTRHDLGREKFVERVWEWKQQSGGAITHQMRRLGASVDWSRERFTMDEGLSTAVRRVFVEWHRAGLLYRDRRLVNWDPVLMTAVSDLEVDSQEKDGSLWSIRYPAADGGEGLVVATTRPETMLGDVAVAVNPDDERYAHLVGKTLKLPLTDREIPVIADAYVERDFGTGAVKITPAHDFNDYQVWQRHKVGALKGAPRGGLLNVLTPDARLKNQPDDDYEDDFGFSKHAEVAPGLKVSIKDSLGVPVYSLIPEKYRGLDRFIARKQIVADLEAAGLLVETKKHKLQVPVSQRTGAIIEPMLTKQWFLDLTSDTRVDGKPGPGGRKAITEPALAAVRDGAIRFVPESWSTTYNQWLENIQDWCVSRQLWWGHQIPVWYDSDGELYVEEDEAAALKAYIGALQKEIDSIDAELASISKEQLEKTGHRFPSPQKDVLSAKKKKFQAHLENPKLTQDPDVLDTWFSSALWPFSTMGWPAAGPVRNERGEIVADWASDQVYVPSAVLVTGFDIIFFWVARMVMATQYFTGKVPFREVYINAIVRDAEGQKMSKSKGNTIDPLDLIDGIELDALVKKSTASLLIPQVREKVEKRIRKEYPNGIAPVGADALRFTFAALATYGRTINFDLKRADGYRHFCNKLWNAARFVLMNLPDDSAVTPAAQPVTEAERWILTRLGSTLAEVEAHFASYRFDLLAQALYEFVWNEYCDWFLELAKPALGGDDPAAAASTRHTLLAVLEAVLRALHPIIPFITEEIWQEVAPRLGLSGDSVSTRAYPTATEFPSDETASSEIEWLKAVLGQIRRIRGEMNIARGKPIPLLYAAGQSGDRTRSTKFDAAIAFLANVESQRWLKDGEAEPASAAAVVGELRVLIPLAGLIDVEAEKQRLDKEIGRIDGERTKSEAKLGRFGANTPAAVIEQEQRRLADFTATLAALREQRDKLAAL